jgi:hypothetical protein
LHTSTIFRSLGASLSFARRLNFSALASCLLLLSKGSEARSTDEIAAEMVKAARETVSTYKKEGMSGLHSLSDNCYAHVNRYKFYCVYVDLASQHIDDAARKGQPWPADEYFASKELLPRVGQIFLMSNMNMEDSNTYLRNVGPAMSKLVDDASKVKK